MRIVDTNTGTNVISGQATSGRKTRDLLASEDSTILLPMPPVMITTAGAGGETVEDAVISWPATTLSTYDVNVTVPSGGYSTGPITYASSNTAVATIDSDGNVTPVGPGTTLITVTIPGLNNRLVVLNVVQAGGPTEAALVNFASGSLGAYLVSETSALIGSQSPPPDLPFLQPPPAPSGTNVNIYNPALTARNSGIWTGTLDLSCIPLGGEGVLLAPDIVAFATHVGTPPTSMTFVGVSNTLYPVSVSSTTYVIPSPSGDGADITIGRLTSTPWPSGDVNPVALLPANFRSYLPQPQYGYPVVFTNQDKTLLIADNTGYFAYLPGALAAVVMTHLVNPQRSVWWYQIRVGDSGNPIFQVIDGALVLVSLWHFMAPDAGPIYADNITQINDAIGYTGSTSTVTTVDLSAFNTY
jgi:hypothetical protein